MRSLSLSPVHRLVLAWARACLYNVTVVMSGVVEALTSITRSLPRKEHASSRAKRLCRALTLNVSRGVMMGYYACRTIPVGTFLQS